MNRFEPHRLVDRRQWQPTFHNRHHGLQAIHTPIMVVDVEAENRFCRNAVKTLVEAERS